jgi:AcrR family transcriptional regulator
MARVLTRKAKADETRARIFAAAVRSFSELGYVNTTVDRIAKDAGVAKGTFFVHFATKDAVVTELVRTQVRVARKARDRALARGGTPVDALRATVLSLGEQAGANRGLSRAVVTANVLSTMLGGFAESLFDGIAAEMRDDARAAQRLGLLGEAVPAETVAETLVTTYFGALLHFATAPRPPPLLALLEPLLDGNLAGFAPASEPPKAAKPKAAKPKRARRPAR